jgi:alpha-acetolactate decarboxylase
MLTVTLPIHAPTLAITPTADGIPTDVTAMPEIVAVDEVTQEPRDLYQTAPLQALLDGALGGTTPLRTLIDHGNFGLGTWPGLDGEMVVNDGRVYRIGPDGRAEHITDLARTTPFAMVTRFHPDARGAHSRFYCTSQR